MLKIAPGSFFADYGAHVRILEETLALQRLGGTVAICTYAGGRDVFGVDIRRAAGTPWTNGVQVGSSYHRMYLDIFLLTKAITTAIRFRPDIIHAHLHEGALIAYPIALVLGIPIVFDFQGSLTSEMLDHNFLSAKSLFFRPLRWIESVINRLADVILTSSHNSAKILTEKFGVSPSRVRPVPDAVNPETFRPRWSYTPAEIAAKRASLNIPPDAKLVVYLGLLAEYQGSGHLLRAAALLCGRRPDVHFLLMGFPGHKRYETYAGQLGISSRVTFTGRLPYEEAPFHLAIGDVAVSPKLSETEGNQKLLNYMAIGLPTVTFATPVSQEILGLLGRYAPLKDDAALADEIEFLLDDLNGEELGRALRQRAIECFSWDAAGKQIIQIYTGLMGVR